MIVLALILAAVIIVVYVIPDDNSYVEPNVNEGLIEVDDFDLKDPYSGSSAKGRILVINDGEFKVKLVAEMDITEKDFAGFGVTVLDGAVVDRFYCEFNGDIAETEGPEGYSWFFYNGNLSHGRGMTQITVDSSSVYATGKHRAGSGTLIVDFKMDPKKDIRNIDTVEFIVGVGSRVTEEGYQDIHPAYQRFFLPTVDENKEEKGDQFRHDDIVSEIKVGDSIDPVTIQFEGNDLSFYLSPDLTVNDDGSFTFTPNLTIPADQGKFRSLTLSFYPEPYDHTKVTSATYTDFESLDPKAYAYGSQYYLTKGATIESDELVFTDSRTFSLDEDYDKGHMDLLIRLDVSQGGYVNTFSLLYQLDFSKSGIFYDVTNYRLSGHEETNPTDGEMLDFKLTVESGNVVVITGDFTKISRLTDMGVEYDPESVATAVWYDRETGEFYSKVFYDHQDFQHELDVWAISIMS
jgi:hypothetical protein